MNTSQLNQSILNGYARKGFNTILTGGINITSAASSKYKIDARLTGGLSTTSFPYSKDNTWLQGGIFGLSQVDARLKVHVFLNGGIISEQLLESERWSFDPALVGGIFSNKTIGGTIKADARLSGGLLGFQSQVGSSPIGIGRVLLGGINGTAYLTGNLRGGAVLIADGIKSTSKVDAKLLNGFVFNGGINSTTSVGGKYKYPAYLTGGIKSNHEVGKEIDISAMLHDGVMCTNTVGASISLGHSLSGGILKTDMVSGRIQLSWDLLGGFNETDTLGGRIIGSTILTGGNNSSTYLGGNGIIVTQWLRGGIISDSGNFVDGQLKTHVLLQGDLASFARLGGDIYSAFEDPLLNTWALEICSATELLEIKHPTEDI